MRHGAIDGIDAMFLTQPSCMKAKATVEVALHIKVAQDSTEVSHEGRSTLERRQAFLFEGETHWIDG